MNILSAYDIILLRPSHYWVDFIVTSGENVPFSRTYLSARFTLRQAASISHLFNPFGQRSARGAESNAYKERRKIQLNHRRLEKQIESLSLDDKSVRSSKSSSVA